MTDKATASRQAAFMLYIIKLFAARKQGLGTNCREASYFVSEEDRAMTDQERQLLEELAGRIQKAPSPQIDREADDLIRRGIGSRPDALYILTQTVLIQEMALTQAKQQLEDLKRQQPPTSFLGNNPAPPQGGTGWGGDNRVQQPAPAPGGYRSSTYQSGYVPPPAPPPVPQQYSSQPQYAQPDYGAPRSGFSSFLQSAAQTAAGVVAGEVAFSAISSLFGHHGGYYGGGGFLGGGETVISPVSETIINNNYYEDNREDNRSYSTDSGSGDYSNDSSSDYSDDSSDDSSDDTSDDSSYDDGSDSSDS
jgi:hypothetical protein